MGIIRKAFREQQVINNRKWHGIHRESTALSPVSSTHVAADPNPMARLSFYDADAVCSSSVAACGGSVEVKCFGLVWVG